MVHLQKKKKTFKKRHWTQCVICKTAYCLGGTYWAGQNAPLGFL